MSIGERIRAARERRGMSQADVVRSSGFSSKLISYLESGNQKNTTIPTVLKLADALDTSTDYLLGRIDEKMDQVLQAIINLTPGELAAIAKFFDEKGDGDG